MQANLDKISIPKGFVLYDWQKDFLNNHDKDRVLLCAEAGTGKTIAGICWMKLRSKVKTLVIAPRSTVKKWREELDKWGVKADVISTDYIKKTNLKNYGALVVDECQNFCSALFDKTRSYRSTILYNHIRQHPNVHVFLASATPIRSKPENLHTLLCYLGVYWDRKKFRDEFLHLTNKFGRIHYEPNSDWRKKIRPYLEKHAHIVLMSDCVDVPVHEYKVINIKCTKKQENELKKQQYEEPAKEWHTRHRLEQGDNKWKEVQKILDGNRKVVLVCFYLDQIEDYRKRIGDNRQVFVLTGSTKDQGQVVTDANESGDLLTDMAMSLLVKYDIKDEEMEGWMKTDSGWLRIVSHPDTMDSQTFALREYKTGRVKWTQKKADNWFQLRFYAMLVYIVHGVVPPSCHLDWIETFADSTDEDKVKPTGHVETFEVKIGLKEILETMAITARVGKEIEAEWTTHEKPKEETLEEWLK